MIVLCQDGKVPYLDSLESVFRSEQLDRVEVEADVERAQPRVATAHRQTSRNITVSHVETNQIRAS